MTRRAPFYALAIAAAAAAAVGIVGLSRLLGAVIGYQEALMSTTKDLTDAVTALGQADARLLADFEALRDQIANMPTDRPLDPEEQAALDAAVVAIQERTAAILAVDPDPNQPVKLGHKAGSQGGVVELVDVDQAVPASMTGPQGGVVDLDDENPTPTEGVPGEAQYVDLGAGQPIEVAANPPAGEAAEKAAERKDDGDNAGADPSTGDHGVTEPAPPAPLSEAPGGSLETSSGSSVEF